MKRKKGRKASKRTVRCTICTTYRWMGNTKERFNHNTNKRKAIANEDLQSISS